MADAAQFAIDIAAQMSGAEQTFAQLDALSSQLQTGGAKASHFEDAIQRVSTQLDDARSAASASAAALADGAAEYKIAERALVQAGKAAEKAAKKNKGVVPDDLQTKVDKAAQAVDKYAAELKGLEATAEDAAAKQDRLGKTLSSVSKLSTHVKDKLGDTTTNLSTFRGALGDVGGPLGEFGERLLFPAQALVDLNEKFGLAKAAAVVGVVGLAAVAAAVVALNAVLIVGIAKLAAYAVKLGDTTRSAGLTRDALEAINPALRGLRGDFTALQRSTGVTEDTLRGLTKSLQDAKIPAAELPTALKAAALAEAALGSGGASKFIERIKKSKLTVDEFARTTQDKFGGIVAAQMLGLEAQGSRFRSNIASLFGGLDIEPALKGLRTLVALFDENTVAGKTVKFLFEKIFQPLIDNAQAAAYVVEAFALGFLIWMTKLYIGVKPYIAKLEDFLGLEDGSLADTLSSAKSAGELFAKALAAVALVFGVVSAAVVAVIAGFVAIPAAFAYVSVAAAKLGIELIGGLVEGITGAASAVWDAISGVVTGLLETVKSLLGISSPSTVFAGIGGSLMAGLAEGVSSAAGAVLGAVTGAASAALEYVSSISLSEIGANLMAGLAAGITGAAGAVAGAVSGAVKGAIGAAKSLLGISSPSKVFAAIGSDTAEGMTGEIESQTDTVQAAMTAMVAPPEAEAPTLAAVDRKATDALGAPAGGAHVAPAAAQNSAAPAGGGGPSLDFSGASFIFQGVEGAEDAEFRFSELLTRLLEGDVAQLGGAEAATA